MLVQDLMTRDVIAVRPDTPLVEVARLLVEHRIGGVPVVDEDNVVLGVVSETDFVIKERSADYSRSRFDRLIGRSDKDAAKVAAKTAGEAMTTPAIAIEGRVASVREAAIAMLERDINRLPVTESGRLVGILTRGDLVRLFAEPESVIADRLRERLRAVDGVSIESVENGVATLVGFVETRAVAETAAALAGTMDGVIAVNRERLTWRVESDKDLAVPLIPM